jgi:tRNA1(Val) A37 N6-methylase TrmN6
MQPLEKSLRNQLETIVKQARDVAEEAAQAALNQIGVGEASPLAHLTVEDRDLRRRLRAHGRQLGDSRSAKGIQAIDRLVEEVAYEYWHRMLFARFLAENNLLMYPDPEHPVSVSLEECEDLASEEGASNGWELAARFAAHMLPQIFRPDSPVFGLHLPPEHEQSLQSLVAKLPEDVFLATDSLGWVYQFWQSKKKEEVNNAEVKIGARELPAVTQLFTEPYMVSFLLDNTLGAWWAGKRLSKSDLKNATSEEELRQMARLPGVPLEYLRFIQNDDGVWTPAGGKFEGWPDKLSELKILDPCCGSGHFLVAIFLMLVPMRMELEGLTAEEAAESVIKHNLHGLDIDQRVTEIAAFAIALNAWRYPGASGYRQLPQMNIACSGLSVSVSKEEWQKLANGDKKLRASLGLMYEQFQDAPLLGSLIGSRRSDAGKIMEWDGLTAGIKQALKKERSDEEREAGVVAQGMVQAAAILSDKYHLVITNVPYLARGKQSDRLKEFCHTYYSEAKNDLATVFLDRCLDLCYTGGTTSIVLPQNWLFAITYSAYRIRLLRTEYWHLIARLGEGGFESSAAAGAFTILLVLSRGQFSKNKANVLQSHLISTLDASILRTAIEKAQFLISGDIKKIKQYAQLDNPDARVVFKDLGNTTMLYEYAISFEGLSTGDLLQFGRFFWELSHEFDDWEFLIGSVTDSVLYGGREQIIYWQNGNGTLHSFAGSYIKGANAWGKIGVRVTQLRSLACTIYNGEIFDKNAATIIPKDNDYLLPIYEFCQSDEFRSALRQIDQRINVMIGTMVKVPFDLEYWQSVADEKYPNGLPKPYSDDPTQWIFHGHPAQSEAPLQVAVARLLGYRWPAELDPDMELSDEARELVRCSEDLTEYADEDGIICIPAVRGEAPAGERLLNLLVKAYGDKWTPDTLSDLLAQADHAGKSLETWLQDKFFLQHCKLFHHRPFIWHIWDGLRDGFAALVNYHKLDRKNLETLIYTYLGDWIARQKQDRNNGVDGAEEKLAAAENLKKRLELILEGKNPYDIFVRWKPVSEQPVGWEPDLNDGVRLNIRPFMKAEVLRYNKKPQLNITWGKDRGKDVESAPWYHLFNGDRINDHHLSLEEKQAARELG